MEISDLGYCARCGSQLTVIEQNGDGGKFRCQPCGVEWEVLDARRIVEAVPGDTLGLALVLFCPLPGCDHVPAVAGGINARK